MINETTDIDQLNDTLDKATDIKFSSPASAIATIRSILGLIGLELPVLPDSEGEYYFKIDDLEDDAYVYIIIEKDFNDYEAFAAIINQDEYEELNNHNV